VESASSLFCGDAKKGKRAREGLSHITVGKTSGNDAQGSAEYRQGSNSLLQVKQLDDRIREIQNVISEKRGRGGDELFQFLRGRGCDGESPGRLL